MIPVAERALSSAETAVLESALRQSALVQVNDTMLSTLSALRVVGICACGCKSVYFEPIAKEDTLLADTWGTAPGGGHLGIMVWGREGRVTALDIVDYESKGELPVIETIGKAADHAL